MTKKNADLIPIKEAANLVNKSVRTIKRYLDKLDKVDRKRMSTLSNGRVLVSTEFVELVKDGKLPKNSKKRQETPRIEKIANETQLKIEALETHNKELFEIIKKKDDLLEQKDILIKENLQDFKTLTSKVLFLQEENKNLQLPESVTGAELNKKNPIQNIKNAVWLFLFFGVLLILCVFVVYILK